jgi:diacylglycerol O-acyltransferase / wax synthase
MPRKRIAFADHAWLRMDDPNNLMVITGLMTFDTPVDYERLKSLIENSMLRVRRFRQRLLPSRLPWRRPYWEDDPHFDLVTHLERVTLPPPGDQQTLQELISRLMSTELDHTRPLWKFYLIENYGSGSAFIARLHHSIADGIALTQVLLSLTEPASDIPATDQSHVFPQSEDQSTSTGIQAALEPTKTLKSSSIASKVSPRNVMHEGKRILLNPSHAVHRARQGIGFAAAVGKIVLRWPDPATVFKGSLGREKRAAWSEPIDLQDIKFIGKTLDSTVNDILITAVAGALGRYSEYRGVSAEDLNIRGFIPINLRPVELDEQLGNKFGLLFLSLPLGITDPVERLHQIKQNMDELKSSAEAFATFGIINLIGAVPARLEELAIDFFDTKGTTIMTNVPGPRNQLYLAGAPINTIMAWVPQSGNISLGVSIISYNGKVWLGVATDKGLIPDPETIVSMFNLEYKELLSQAQTSGAERATRLHPSLSMLDETLQTLDELLADIDSQTTQTT